jgi:NADH-quinone oxidoreductase subunit N
MSTILAASTWLPNKEELWRFSPELALIATIVAILIFPLAAGRRTRGVGLLVLLGAAAGLMVTVGSAGPAGGAPETGFAPPGGAPVLLVDGLSVFFRGLIFALLILITWLWYAGAHVFDWRTRPAAEAAAAPEFFLLLLTSALGMLLMLGTTNLLMIVIAMETASLPSYAIVASDKRSRLGAEAGLKYVTFGAAASAIMVFGVSLLYGQFGTLDLTAIAGKLHAHGSFAAATDATLFALSILALGVGVLFKIAAAPLHLWCPDVFEGAPVEITTWLSIASKAAGVGLLLRLTYVFGGSVAGSSADALMWAIGALAAATCTIGNLAALRQDSVKRTLAYSSIAHAGYMMMVAPLLRSNAAGGASEAAVSAIIAYLLIYVAMNVGAFCVTAVVAWHAGTDQLAAFNGLGRRAPWLALPMAICLFSLVGLPPLGGFTAKWYLLVALGKGAAAQPWLWGLVVIAVLNTVVSLYYYVRVIRHMYLVDDSSLPMISPPATGVILANACAVFLLLTGTLLFNRVGVGSAFFAIGFGDGVLSP